ncbi:AAA family ATPase [Archaeoglobus sp.]
MQVKIKNWRCIEEVEFDLSRINIFLGQNATGKSSLAYALYVLSRSHRFSPLNVIKNVYSDLWKVVRRENDTGCFPIELTVEDFSIEIYDDRRFAKQGKAVWSDETLLPSGRIVHFQIFELIKSGLKTESDIMALPLPSVAKEYIRNLLELKINIRKTIIAMLSDQSYTIIPEVKDIQMIVRDEYTNLIQTPIDLPPDGTLDRLLIESALKAKPENSLIVIEEPEIHKNPLLQIDMINRITELALSKKLTVVMTTHSEIIPLSIAKLIEENKLRPDDVRIYYLTRSKDEPWTKVKKIEIYEDGTLEELPDSEKVTAQLF